MRTVRLDRKLTQSKIAKIIGVTTNTITYSELNRNKPTVKYASKIIKLIGYFPFEWKDKPLPIQMKYARMMSGHTVKEINCECSSLMRVERGTSMPSAKTKEKIEIYIQGDSHNKKALTIVRASKGLKI